MSSYLVVYSLIWKWLERDTESWYVRRETRGWDKERVTDGASREADGPQQGFLLRNCRIESKK